MISSNFVDLIFHHYMCQCGHIHCGEKFILILSWDTTDVWSVICMILAQISTKSVSTINHFLPRTTRYFIILLSYIYFRLVYMCMQVSWWKYTCSSSWHANTHNRDVCNSIYTTGIFLGQITYICPEWEWFGAAVLTLAKSEEENSRLEAACLFNNARNSSDNASSNAILPHVTLHDSRGIYK